MAAFFVARASFLPKAHLVVSSKAKSTLLQDLPLLIAAGTLIRGADVYHHATRRSWWAWPDLSIFHYAGAATGF